MNFNLRLLASTMSLAFAATAFAADEPKKDAAPTPDWTITGHVDLNSAYYLRGATTTYGNASFYNFTGIGNKSVAFGNRNADAPESDKPVLQWGADFVHSSGLYLGYWGSQVNYSYKQLGESYDCFRKNGAVPGSCNGGAVPFTPYDPTDARWAAYLNASSVGGFVAGPGGTNNWYQKNLSIENDFYGGYNGKVGELGYNVGLTYYYYINGSHSDAPETKIALTYGEFTAQAQTLLLDTIWGNAGDTYWTAVWTKALPYDLTFTANLGAYTYTREGTYLGSKNPNTNTSCTASLGAPVGLTGATSGSFFVNGCYWNEPGKSGPVSGGFRHLILGISQPIGSTGLTWNAQAIIGGVNRYDIQQENKITAGISYAF